MKRVSVMVINLLLLTSLTTFAQSGSGGVPSKWSKENVIVLNHSMSHSHLMSNKGKTYTKGYSNSLKLEVNNSAGINELKKLYIPSGIECAIQVTKESSSVFDYDDRDAVDMDKGALVPEVFTQFYPEAEEFKVINLDNLEDGDVIDISYTTSEEMETKKLKSTKCAVIEANNYVLATPYPVANKTISYKISQDFLINAASLNNGPLIDDIGTSGEEDDLVYSYEFEALEIDKIEDEQFMYPMRTYPSVKVEIILCDKADAEGTDIIAGPVGEVFDDWDETLLKDVVYNKYSIWESLGKKHFKDLTEFTGIIKGAKTPDRVIEGYYRALQGYVYGVKAIEDYSDDVFMGVMLALCNENEFKHEVIVGFNKETADPDEMIMNGDLEYCLKVSDSKDEWYVFPMNQFSRWNDANHRLAGTDGYALKYEKKQEESALEPTEIPMAQPAQNQLVIRRNVSMDLHYEAAVVSEKVQLKGSEKNGLANIISTDEDFNSAILNRSQVAEYQGQMVTGNIKQQQEARSNFFAAQLTNRFDSVGVDRFNYVSSGVEEKSEWSSYKQKYRVYGLTRFDKKDSLYYFKLGKLLTKSIDVTSSMRRESPIFIGYPKIVDTRIVFKLAGGVSAFGADNFEKSVDVDMATLKSKAVIKGDRIIISCSMVFKEDYLDAKDWQKLQMIAKAQEELDNLEITLAVPSN